MNKNTTIDGAKAYSNRIHLIGRITVVCCLTCFIMLPIILSWIYKAPIQYGVTLENATSILLMFTFAAICENVSYAPIIGAGALYTSCVTGDLSNMKVPAAINAMEVAEVSPGTEKGDIVSLMAVSTCTFVTTTIALLGMIFLAPIIDPIFNNPYINPAFANMIPAIFGAILIPRIVKNPKEGLPVLLIPLVVILIIGHSTYSTNQSYLMVGVAIISIAYSYFINRKSLRMDKETAGEETLSGDDVDNSLM